MFINVSEEGLTKLEQYPEELDGDFHCGFNEITSLEGCPKIVKGDFTCTINQLTNLKGGPKEVEGDYDCNFNRLTTLEGSPDIVNGSFDCSENSELTSLKGGPKFINKFYICNDNIRLEDISDLPETTTLLKLNGCTKIKIFPKHIKNTLTIIDIEKAVYKRLLKQKHLEIIKEDGNVIIIKEKSLNDQFLDSL